METHQNNISILLSIAEGRRLHWSSQITNLIGFTSVINVGVLGYFIAAYVNSGGTHPSLLLIGASISAFTVGAWRFYSRYIDNEIAQLYPEIFLYEKLLLVNDKTGISGYLIRNVNTIEQILLQASLTVQQKTEILHILARKRKLGYRGHFLLNLFGIIWTFTVLVACVIGIYIVRNSFDGGPKTENIILYISCFAIVISGIIFALIAHCKYHKNPQKEDIDSALINSKKA